MNRQFNLPSEFNIYNVLNTRDSLLAWVDKYGPKTQDPLHICADQVTEVDAAGLQLLASLGNTELAKRWQLVEPSEAFEQACRALGFAQWLQCAAAEKPSSVPSKKRKASA